MEGGFVLLDIKLINTILSGCEYSVSKKNVFVIINQAWLARHESFLFPNEAIVIPTQEETSCNFSIKFPEEDSSDYFFLIHDQEKKSIREEIPLIFNQIYSISGVRLVVKESCSRWNYKEKQLPQQVYKKNGRRFLSKRGLIGFLFLMLALIIPSLITYQYDAPKRYLTQITELFANNKDVQVTLGYDQNIYILANDKNSEKYAFEIKNRYLNDFSGDIKIKNIQEEKAALSRWVIMHWSTLIWDALEWTDIKNPVLVLNKQTRSLFNPEKKQQFIESLKKMAPYIKSIVFIDWDNRELIAYARKGLNQLNVSYQEETDFYHTFIIQGELDDSDLIRLKHFITDFYQTWDEKYVHFIIRLQQDFLKTYSFKNGSQNYIKITKNHWYMPVG